jgi:chaperonin cofactor prefoldin
MTLIDTKIQALGAAIEAALNDLEHRIDVVSGIVDNIDNRLTRLESALAEHIADMQHAHRTEQSK